MTGKYVDIIIACMMFAFGVWVLTLTGSIRLGSVVGVIGPKFFPQLLATIIMSMSVLLGINSLARRRYGSSDPVTSNLGSDVTSKRFLSHPVVRVAALLSLVSGYVLALDLLGYRISSIFFICLLLLFKGMCNPVRVVVTAVTLMLSLYLLFHVLLSIPLPVGSLTDVR